MTEMTELTVEALLLVDTRCVGGIVLVGNAPWPANDTFIENNDGHY